MEKLTDSLVKGVPSGDSVSLSGNIKKGVEEVPEEKQLYLSLVSSPRCASNNNPEDEPYGTESRNYLKSLVLGKVVKYTIDYKVGDKLFGQIFSDNKNINLELVRSGYCKIGFLGKSNESLLKGEYYSKLQNAENEAKKNKLNIWCDDTEELELHRYRVTSLNDTNFNELFEKCKGTLVNAVIEFVFNVSLYSLLIKDTHNCYIKASLRFIAVPSKDTVLYRTGKAFIERIALHRDVQVVMHAIDDYGNIIVDIINDSKSLAINILKRGYTKLYISNNIANSRDDITMVKNAQAAAQKEGLRIWKGSKLDLGDDEKKISRVKTAECSDFEGLCIQVNSGDCFNIKSSTSGETYRIFMSHIKAPTFGKLNTDEPDQPWAWQAKEHLRKILVGKKIRVEFDYTKDIKDKKMNFYSVFRSDGSKEINVNEELVEHGLVHFSAPRGNDMDISKYLETYSTANTVAKGKKVGLHSTKEPGNPNYSDLIAANPKKKREFINFLTNQKNLHCVVEFVFSATKLKLRIEKNKCMVLFSIQGIKTVAKDKNNTDLYNKILATGSDYVNEHFMQREGTCDITHSDKMGNYFGNLYIGGVNVANILLQEGLAVYNPYANTTHAAEYKKNEKIAIEKKSVIWAHEGVAYFLKEGESGNSTTSAPSSSKLTEKNIPETIKLRVTDIIDFGTFYCNFMPNNTLTKIETLLDEYDNGVHEALPLEKPIKKGVYCVARYPEDYRYYRAKITSILKGDKYEVEFIDYGSVALVGEDDLIKMDNSISDIEPQVMICEFAYLKYSKNSRKKAVKAYPDFVNIDVIQSAQLYYTYAFEGKTRHGVIIHYRKTCSNLEETFHHDLLVNGLAKLDTKKGGSKAPSELKGYQKKAEEASKGMWAEGEESDEEIDNDN